MFYAYFLAVFPKSHQLHWPDQLWRRTGRLAGLGCSERRNGFTGRLRAGRPQAVKHGIVFFWLVVYGTYMCNIWINI